MTRLRDKHRNQAIALAKRAAELGAVVFDTETTGLGKNAEIVDIACVDLDGTVLLDSLVCPSLPIPGRATGIHGITNGDVRGAPTFDQLIGYVDAIFEDRLVVSYNLGFDLRMVGQSLRNLGLGSREYMDYADLAFDTYWGPGLCAMRTFAKWHGAWNSYRGNYRWHKLLEAAGYLGVHFPEPQHRARADAIAAAGVLKELAGM